jgi:hypothetical protein
VSTNKYATSIFAMLVVLTSIAVVLGVSQSFSMVWLSTLVVLSVLWEWISPRFMKGNYPVRMFIGQIVSFCFVFAVALGCGLHHPPLIATIGWKWPPFSSWYERFVRAFALSIWALLVFPFVSAIFCLFRWSVHRIRDRLNQ